MQPFIKYFAGAALAASLLAPLSAYALGTSFGGRIIDWEPCVSLPGAIFILIQPAGIFPIAYFWAPGTLGLPPTHIGQQILGVADTFFGCTTPLGPRAGQRIQIDGVSI